jgi:hypothetical protein
VYIYHLISTYLNLSHRTSLYLILSQTQTTEERAIKTKYINTTNELQIQVSQLTSDNNKYLQSNKIMMLKIVKLQHHAQVCLFLSLFLSYFLSFFLSQDRELCSSDHEVFTILMFVLFPDVPDAGATSGEVGVGSRD